MPSNFQIETALPQIGLSIMISACLLGIECRYDGRHSMCPDLVDLMHYHNVIPFCPEQLGGLPTPRPSATMVKGDGYDILSGVARVINVENRDVTRAFKKGAEEALRLARLTGSTIALMKEKSPSCGLRTPYCDKPSGHGIGVTAALFKSEGINMVELGLNDTFSTHDFLRLIGS